MERGLAPSATLDSADALAFSVVRLRNVVAPATVRADHAARHARPRLLLAMALAHRARPRSRLRRRGERFDAQSACSSEPPLQKHALVGGAANSHTFRSESRYSATALRLVATRHQHAGRDLASTPPPVGFALSAAPRLTGSTAACAKRKRLQPRAATLPEYSGLPCAREHLPHTGGDFSHDQPADRSTAARSPSMVCSANVTRFSLASPYTSRCIRMYHRYGGANQRGGRRQAHRPGHAPLRTADEA